MVNLEGWSFWPGGILAPMMTRPAMQGHPCPPVPIYQGHAARHTHQGPHVKMMHTLQGHVQKNPRPCRRSPRAGAPRARPLPQKQFSTRFKPPSGRSTHQPEGEVQDHMTLVPLMTSGGDPVL